MKTFNDKIENIPCLIKHYQAELGLMDYEIVYKTCKDFEYRGSAKINYVGKIATIEINEELCEEKNFDELKKTIFHECMEILFNKIRVDMQIIYSDEHVAERIHDIIRVFENMEFRKIKEQREEKMTRENHDLTQFCLENLGQIEKTIIKLEEKLKEFENEIENEIEKIKMIELQQAKSYIETQKELLNYFVKEDKND